MMTTKTVTNISINNFHNNSMKNQITSLSALKEEKKKLRMEIELSKREFAHSLGSSRANLKEFLLKKVAIPAGVAGLGVAGVSKLMSSNENHQNGHQSNQFGGLLAAVLPVIATAAQTYFFKKESNEHRN